MDFNNSQIPYLNKSSRVKFKLLHNKYRALINIEKYPDNLTGLKTHAEYGELVFHFALEFVRGLPTCPDKFLTQLI